MSAPLRLLVMLEALDKVSGPMRNIVSGSRGLQQSLRDNQRALKALGEQRNHLSTFARTRAELKATQPALDALRAKSDAMRQRAAEQAAAHDALTGEIKAERLAVQAMSKALYAHTHRSEADVDALRQRQAALARLESRHRQSGASLRKLTAEHRAAERGAQGLAQKQRELGDKLAGVRGKLEAAGVKSGQFGARQRELRREMGQASAAIDQQRKKLGQWEQSRAHNARLQKMAGGMALAGGAATAAGGVMLGKTREALQPGIDYEARLRDIRITAGFDARQEAQLGAQIRSDALRFGQTADAISQGMQQLTANGITSAAELQRFSGVLAKTTVATGAESTDISATIVAARQNLKVLDSEMGRMFDGLSWQAKQGSFEMRDMAKWFPALTPMMESLGGTGRDAITELGAALQIARRGAGTNDEAANNLSNFLSKVTLPDTIKDFSKAGIDLKSRLIQLQAKGIGPLQGSLQVIEEYMGKKGPAVIAKYQRALAIKDDQQRLAAVQQLAEQYALGELFQDREALRFIRPALANRAEMQRLATGGAEATGGIDRDWALRMETAQKRLDRFNIRMDELKLKAFDRLGPALEQLANGGANLAERFGAWAQRNPELAGGLAKIAVIGAATTTVLGAIGVVGGTALFGIARLSQGALILKNTLPRLAAALGPVGWGMALVAGIGYLVYKNWDSISARTRTEIDSLKRYETAIRNAFGTRLQAEIDGVPRHFSQATAFIRSDLAALDARVASAGTGLRGHFRSAWDFVVNDARVFGARLHGFFDGLRDRFFGFGRNLVQGLVNGITGLAGRVGNALVTAGNTAVARFRGAMGIRSPSRVFMVMGGHLTDGLAAGLRRGADHPMIALGQIARRMAGISLPALAVAGAGQAQPLAMPAPSWMPQVLRVESTMRGLAQQARPLAMPAPSWMPQVLRVESTMPGLVQQARIGTSPPPPVRAAAARAPVMAPAASGGDHYTFHFHGVDPRQRDEVRKAVMQAMAEAEQRKASRQRSQLWDYGD